MGQQLRLDTARRRESVSTISGVMFRRLINMQAECMC